MDIQNLNLQVNCIRNQIQVQIDSLSSETIKNKPEARLRETINDYLNDSMVILEMLNDFLNAAINFTATNGNKELEYFLNTYGDSN